MTIGELIHNRRKEMGITLEELGNVCGVKKTTVSKWEKGIIRDIGCSKIMPICMMLDLRLSEVLEAACNDGNQSGGAAGPEGKALGKAQGEAGSPDSE